MTVGVARETESRVAPAYRAVQEKKFLALMQRVLRGNPFYRTRFEELGFAHHRKVGLSDLSRLPFTTITDVRKDQQATPPYGTNLSFPVSRFTRMHRASRSKSAFTWLDTAESWEWWATCWAEALRAAGVTEEDRVLIASPLGPEVDFLGAFDGAQRAGAMAISRSGLSDKKTQQLLRAHDVRVLVATAEDALCLAGGDERQSEPSPECVEVVVIPRRSCTPDPETDARIEARWGARVSSVALSTEIGVWAHRCSAGARVHVNEAEFIIEVIDPRSGELAPRGDDGVRRGEAVLTNLGRVGSPLIRYRTGQTVALSRQPCPCEVETAVLTRS